MNEQPYHSSEELNGYHFVDDKAVEDFHFPDVKNENFGHKWELLKDALRRARNREDIRILESKAQKELGLGYGDVYALSSAARNKIAKGPLRGVNFADWPEEQEAA